jgi:glycosyltransferase involved in cell wall biosynthesis
MNILVVSTQFPFPTRSGVTTRIYQLVRQLAARHDVTLLSYARAEDAEGVAALSEELPVRVVQRSRRSQLAKRSAQLGSIASLRPFAARDAYSAEMQQAIDELCAGQAFDFVQLESTVLAGLSVPPGPKVVIDEHNIEYEIFQRVCAGERSVPRRLFNHLEYLRFRRFEQRCWRRIDGCVVTSEREAPVVRAHAPGTPTVVVPNGVDIDMFAPGDEPVEPQTVVFNGTLDYRPNLDAVAYLVDEVWPLVVERCPGARLSIVGYAGPDDVRRLQRPGVVFTGQVPDVRPHLRRAAVVAVPVRMGGGTRLKIVEGLSLGKAIVSTSLGCEGIAVVDNEHLLIGDDAQAFAEKVTELFAQPARREALGKAGRGLAEREYSWALAGDRLDALYRQLASEPEPNRVPTALPRVAIDGAQR